MRTNSHIVLAALDEGDSAIVVLRPDRATIYRIVDINATFSRISNYTSAEALGMSLWDLHGSMTDTVVQQKIDDAMSVGKSLRGEIEIVSRVSRAFWLGFTLMPIVDPDTRVLHCVLLGRDITEKRKQDSEQSAMQTMLAMVFQKVDAPVAIAGSDGYFLLANTAWQALTGYNAQEVPRLTTRQLTPPALQAISAAAHTRQFTDGKPYRLQTAVIHKDRTHIPVHLTSTLVQRGDMKRFRVVTLRPIDQSVTSAAQPLASSAVVGCVQFLGFDAIKEAYGARWGAMAERLLLAAEAILKRRLAPEDVYTRTAEQGFCIWFKNGNEEEGSARVARIGREIRIMLLSELGEEAAVAVTAYAQTATIEDPSASPNATLASLTRFAADRRLEVEQQAKAFLEGVVKQQPSEPTPLNDRMGRVVKASFVDLPPSLRNRFAGAISLVGGARANVDVGLFRLGLAANAALEDVAQGRDEVRLVAIPFALFMDFQGREHFLQHWRSYPAPVGQQLMVMLSELQPKVGQLPLTRAVELLRSITSRIGVLLDDIETPPFNLTPFPFGMVGLVSDSLTDVSDAKLRGFFQKVHDAKARVLIRLSTSETAQRWHALGADLTAAF